MCAVATARVPFFKKFESQKLATKTVQLCNRPKPSSDDDDSRWGECPSSPIHDQKLGHLLPPTRANENKLVVCLDLDETLLHCRLIPRAGNINTCDNESNCENFFALSHDMSTRQVLLQESRRVSPLCMSQLICILDDEGWRSVRELRLLSLRQWADVVNKSVAIMKTKSVVAVIESYEGLDAPAVQASIKFLHSQNCSTLKIEELSNFLSNTVLKLGSGKLPATIVRFLQRVLQENALDAIRTVIDRCLESVHSVKPRPLPPSHDNLHAQGRDFKVWMRPHLDEFMKRLSELRVEVVVFTASLPEYADPLVDALDKYGVVQHRLYRDAVQRSSTGMAKDMTLLGRPIERVVLVDNADYAMALNPDNGIRVHNFHGYQGDDEKELLRVLGLVEELVNVQDVRPRLREEAQRWAAKEVGDASRLSRRFRERVEGRSAPPPTPF